jgi:hypothetical protein
MLVWQSQWGERRILQSVNIECEVRWVRLEEPQPPGHRVRVRVASEIPANRLHYVKYLF